MEAPPRVLADHKKERSRGFARFPILGRLGLQNLAFYFAKSSS